MLSHEDDRALQAFHYTIIRDGDVAVQSISGSSVYSLERLLTDAVLAYERREDKPPAERVLSIQIAWGG